MDMLKKIARLFVIKNRFEAFAIIYAIAVGAVGRGIHYLEVYPGNLGIVLALLCTGVVFLAGAKLLDSVKPVQTAKVGQPALAHAPRHPGLSRSRPRVHPTRFGSRSPLSHRTGSPPTTRQ